MDKRKKLVIMCASLSNGGAERVVSILSQELSQSYEISLILFDGDDVTYKYSGKIINLGFKGVVARVKRFLPISHLTTFFALLYLIFKVRKIKKSINPDCSISFLETPNIVNLASSLNEKIIVSVRSTRSLQNRTFYERVENKFIRFYKKADYIVSTSEGVKEDLVEVFDLPSEKIVTIYNPFQKGIIRNLMEEALESECKYFIDSHKAIITVGRLIPQKNHLRLLHTIAQIKTEIPNIGYVIVGSGEMLSTLKEKAKELNIEESVLFIPFTKNPFKYIAQSQLFVSTSEREGFCNTLVEAMICKVPVVAVDCKSGPREIISGKSNYQVDSFETKICDKGILVPLQKHDLNGQLLYDAVKRGLTDNNIRSYITSGTELWIESLQVDSIVRKWKHFIEN